VLGAFVMQSARARWSPETVASFGVAILGIATIATGIFHELLALIKRVRARQSVSSRLSSAAARR
jgi:hypothetical protein